MTATLADRLNAAADVIEERGHTHGRLTDKQGRVCLLGAINTACTGAPADWSAAGVDAQRAVREELGEPSGVFAVTDWNDAYRNGKFVHGKREAVALLRRTARKAAGQ